MNNHKHDNTKKRIRGRKLQRIRQDWFDKHPLCVTCERYGRVSAAVELDHIIPLCKGGTDDASNYQGLCAACHDKKTAEDLNYQMKYGYTADGTPLDPHHHWSK